MRFLTACELHSRTRAFHEGLARGDIHRRCLVFHKPEMPNALDGHAKCILRGIVASLHDSFSPRSNTLCPSSSIFVPRAPSICAIIRSANIPPAMPQGGPSESAKHTLRIGPQM